MIEDDEVIVEEELPEEQLDEEELPEQEDEQSSEEVPDEVTERAKKFGHLSKEEWTAQGRDPNQWKSPEEFDKTGKILEQLYSAKKRAEKQEQEIRSLVEYQQRTSQREYERARQELESRLAASKDDMDMDRVAQYTRELTRLEDTEQQNHVQRAQQSQHNAKEAFLERNQHWYNDRNPDLVQRAMEIDHEIHRFYPNATHEELAERIEKRMQYDFPDRVLGQAKSRPPSISPSQSSVNKTSVNKTSTTRTFQSLPQDLKDTYSATKRIIESRRDREYTEKDFIEQLKKDGEL